MNISVAIMAHPRRAAFVTELEAQLDRPAKVVFDDGSNSRWGTGRRALLAYDPAAEYHAVIQDDAVIPQDLIAGLERAVGHVPVGSPLCLYVGKTRPYRDLIREYVHRAEDGASWLVMDQLVWGVGVVIPTRHIEAMVAWCDGLSIPNYDTRMSRWFESQGIETWYPYPSLVDHRESPSLVPGRGHAGRVAHRFIGAEASALDTDYAGSVLRLPNISDYRPRSSSMLFYCEKYDNLKVPTIGAQFVDHFFEATSRQQISYLQKPFMKRRGVRPATGAEEGAWRGGAPAAVKDPQPVAETVPDGTAETVLAWVGDDTGRAREAIAAEEARDKPRKTLLGKLDPIAKG